MPHTTPSPISATARRLLIALDTMCADAPTAATNQQLAEQAALSVTHPRTVPAALRRLEAAGLIVTTRTSPHPKAHPSGRLITVTDRGREVVR